MPYTLERRITRKYVGTFSHLDDWETLGSYNVVATGHYADGGDDDDDPCYVGPNTILLVEVQLEQPYPLKDILRALEASNSSFGCHHEYDCCGCVSTSCTAEHVGGNRYLLTQSRSANY